MVDIVCDGPGPHVPESGVLGTSNKNVTGMRCSSPLCMTQTDPVTVNEYLLRERLTSAINSNQTFLDLTTPTAAQILVQVNRLTRETNALIRLTLSRLDDTSGT